MFLIQGTTILTGTNQVVGKLTAGEDKSRWTNGDATEGLNSSWDNIGYTIKHDFIRTKYVKLIIPTEEARCRSCKLEKNHISSWMKDLHRILRKMNNPFIPPIM